MAVDAVAGSCLFGFFYRMEALIHEEGEEARGEGEAPVETEKNKHMPCLLAACASGVPRVVTTALDAIVKVSVCTTSAR